jgi:nitrogen fixation NifU-like protein
MFDDLRELYQEVILDHGRKPRHGHRLASFDVNARGDNPMCGDRVEVFVKLDPAGRVERTGFEARGCAISVASADLMAEVVQGLAPAEVSALSLRFAALVKTGEADDDGALERLRPLAGVHEFPSRVKCATLPWHALLAALRCGQENGSE